MPFQDYLDLFSEEKKSYDYNQHQMPNQIGIYLLLLFGAVFRPNLDCIGELEDLLNFEFVIMPLQSLISVLLSIVIFPFFYRRVFKPRSPFWYQGGLSFIAGIGFRSFFDFAIELYLNLQA